MRVGIYTSVEEYNIVSRVSGDTSRCCPIIHQVAPPAQ